MKKPAMIHPHTQQLAEAAGLSMLMITGHPRELQRFRELVLEDAALQIEASAKRFSVPASMSFADTLYANARVVRALKQS